MASRRRFDAVPATNALHRASVPTWLSNGPGLLAATTKVAIDPWATGEITLSVMATVRAPARWASSIAVSTHSS